MFAQPTVRLGWILALAVACAPASSRAAEDAWTSHGPDNAWVTTLLRPQGPAGDLYAGTYGGGVWRSRDGGETWVDLSDNLAGVAVTDLAYGGGQFPTLYATTADAGIHSSTPPFTRWTPINTGLGGGDVVGVQSVAVHPGSPEVITVATDSGVATSDRWGGFWPIALQWLAGFSFVDIEVHHLAPARIHALQSLDLYVTDDFGRNVFRYGKERGLPEDLLEDLEMWPTSLDTFFVVSHARGVYRGIPGPYFYYSGPAERPVDNPVLYSLKAVPQTRELLLASAEGVYLSDDVGRQWRKLDDGLGTRHQEVFSILVDDPRSLRLWLGSFRYGFLKSEPAGERWRESNRGLRASLVNGVWARDDAILAATAHGRVYRSEDAGQTWEDRTGNLDILQARDILVLPQGRWLVSSTQGLWLTDDDGVTWREPSRPPAQTIALPLLHPAWWPDDHVLLGTYHGVYRSTDAGETWSVVPDVPTGANYLTLAAAPADQTLWLGALGDALYAGSFEDGFVRVPSGPSQSRSYFDLAFEDGGSESVLVATSGGLFRFTADGAGGYTSVDIGQGLPTGAFESVPDVSAVEVVGDQIVVGLYQQGVVRSDDGGITWTDFNEGLRRRHVEELIHVDGTDARLCVATWGAGVAQRELPAPVGVLLQRPRLTQQGRQVLVELETARSLEGTLWRSIDGAAALRLWSGPIEGILRYTDDLSGQEPPAGTTVGYRLDVRDENGLVQSAGAQLLWASDAPLVALRDRLLPGWPNPFNPRINLAVELARSAHATLAVFDVRGRRVTTLLDGEREAGRHDFLWRGTDDRDTLMPSGVYLVQLTVEGTTVARQRITLLR